MHALTKRELCQHSVESTKTLLFCWNGSCFNGLLVSVERVSEVSGMDDLSYGSYRSISFALHLRVPLYLMLYLICVHKHVVDQVLVSTYNRHQVRV